MSVLAELRPNKVWKYFEDLCGIPHGSYNEKGVSDYCVAFAKERGLEVYQDEAWNVVIIKEASEGYEDAEPIILQGHLDMVCEKKPGCDLDFEKDGLRLAIDGDYVYAEGTTLGGDDGIAIAYSLAILDDDSIPHPRLEAIFTTAEEVGMDGAMALDISMLKGHTMLNMDSEEDDTLLVGCAGGCGMVITLPVQREKKTGLLAELTVGGLLGGHSGAEIHKNRGNSNKLLAEVLEKVGEIADFELVSVNGGAKDNAIPRESSAVLLLEISEQNDTNVYTEVCARCEEMLKKVYAENDPDVFVKLQIRQVQEADVMNTVCKETVIRLLNTLPNGVIRMSPYIEGLVQTSLNLGVLLTGEEAVVFRYSFRSSVEKEKNALVEEVTKAAEGLGAQVEVSGHYPGWEYREVSPLREKCVRIYEQMFGEKPKVQAIHAGLECGLLSGKIKDLDCVAMGPNMKDIHTSEERLSISSVEKMWNYILEIIKTR